VVEKERAWDQSINFVNVVVLDPIQEALTKEGEGLTEGKDLRQLTEDEGRDHIVVNEPFGHKLFMKIIPYPI